MIILCVVLKQFSSAISVHYNSNNKSKKWQSLLSQIKLSMRKSFNTNTKITRKCHTQQPQTYYPQHLLLRKKIQLFSGRFGLSQDVPQQKRQSFSEQTNFGFTITNEYLYVLLHLRSKTNKNMLNINIPELCVFVDKLPYDILYSQDGFIRGSRGQDGTKCKLRDVEVLFKEVWKHKKYPKLENCTAVFKQKQVLILSQTDFIISCKKIKSDPFFKKLEYIQNKLPYTGQQIVMEYDQANKEEAVLKLATESMLGFKSQRQLIQDLGQEKYLNFMNEKISLTLNYQHNIRVIRANFHYVKMETGEYFLTNVTNLHLTNLTKALQLREQKMKKLEQARDQLLTLNPEKQRKLKALQNPQDVAKIESVLRHNFESMVNDMNFTTISDSKNEEIKNEKAFRKLHPEIKTNFHELLSSQDFKKTREKIFGSSVNGRKNISIPSKYVLRTYNKTRKSYKLRTEADTYCGI